MEGTAQKEEHLYLMQYMGCNILEWSWGVNVPFENIKAPWLGLQT